MELSLSYLICTGTGEVVPWGRALCCSHREPVPNNYTAAHDCL